MTRYNIYYTDGNGCLLEYDKIKYTRKLDAKKKIEEYKKTENKTLYIFSGRY